MQPRHGQHVLYFALRPDPQAADEIAAACARLRRDRRIAGDAGRRDRWHVSLRGLGPFDDLSDATIDEMRRVASSLSGAAFRIEFNRVALWRPRRRKPAIVLAGDDGVIGADRLGEKLGSALVDAGVAGRDTQGGAPHLTLFYSNADSFDEAIEPIGWMVREFVLLHTLYGSGFQETLGRWRLADLRGGAGSGAP